jgi:AraC-like DNA-binding protein
MDFSLTELYSLFGGLLGIILGLIILLKARGKKEIRVILAFTLLVTSIIAIFGTMMYSGNATFFPHIIRVDSPFVYLLGPACFFYVYSTLKPHFRFRRIYLLHLLPFLFNLAEFTPFYLSNAGDKLEYYQTFLDTGSVILPRHYLLKTLSLSVYLSFQVYYFLRYKQLNKLSTTNRVTGSWFRIFILIQLVSLLGLVTDHLTGLHLFGDPYRFAMLVITTFLYTIALTLLFYPQILYGITEGRFSHQSKYSHSKLSDEEKDAILLKLDTYMSDGHKPYCDASISLPEVARNLDVGLHQLSQVINEKKGFNFNDYVNTFRIEEVKRLLSSMDYKILTIDAIASKAGFQSKSAFYSAFKKHTGMTPREFAAARDIAFI